MNHRYKITILSLFIAGTIFAQSTSRNHHYEGSVITTAKGTEMRLSKSADLVFTSSAQPLETSIGIFIDPSHHFQKFEGIGGALTDAAAETFFKLPKSTQQEFLTAYYDKDKGIGYTIGRTNINSCDFSTDTYTYVKDNDSKLESFNLSHDEKYKIPFIKKAYEASGKRLKLFASPWSPPAWMKDNNDMLHGGKLLPKFAQSWANYYVKFVKGYQKLGIPIWGLTVQNEPMAKQRWESCIFTAADERDFIKNFLGPTLHKNGLSNIKLIGWDHNRDQVYQRASTLLNDPESAKYLWGIGYHWYETWTGSQMLFDNVKLVNEAFPDKHLIFTEGCKEKFDINKVSDWSLGERYGNSMINDFNSGTCAWTDWNVLLDEHGGPNHVGNFCFAPIHADTQSGKLIYTNAYYYLGQFSKYIQSGARRIVASANRDSLLTTAFQNPNGDIVLIVMNATDHAIEYHLWLDQQVAETNNLPHSINTYIIHQ